MKNNITGTPDRNFAFRDRKGLNFLLRSLSMRRMERRKNDRNDSGYSNDAVSCDTKLPAEVRPSSDEEGLIALP